MLEGTGLEGWAKWVKAVKRYKLPIIKQISSGDVMYSTVTVVINIVIKVPESKSKSSQHKKKKEFCNFVW